jgi:hypothetical protein
MSPQRLIMPAKRRTQVRTRKNATQRFGTNCRWMIKHTSWGSTNQWMATINGQNDLSNPNPNIGGGYWIYSPRGIQGPHFTLQGPMAQQRTMQRPDIFWKSICFDNSYWFWWNFDVGPPLVSLSNYLFMHMWIIENGVRMRPGRPFYYTLLLKPEMDLNLTWIGSPTWLGHPCLLPMVVAKEEDVLGHLLGVLHLLGACSNLGLGPKCE